MGDARLVVFDIGGVLVRICRDWAQACREAGLPVEPAEPDVASLAAADRIVDDYETGRIATEEFCRLIAPLRRLTPRQVEAALDAYLLQAYPGARELIDDIHAMGCWTACLSNTNPNHWRILHDPGKAAFVPLDRLTWQFASHLIGHRKPAEQIYQHVERVTGVHPDQIVFFDDTPAHVEAARRRGWLAQLVPPVDNPLIEARRCLIQLGLLHG